MNNTKQIIDNHNKHISNSSKRINETADNSNKKGTKTCNYRQKNSCPLDGNCLQSSLIYQPSHVRITALLKHTSDLQKTTSSLATETTPHHYNTQNTETLPNSTNISGSLNKMTLTTSFMAHPFVKITLQQRKQKMQPLPQRKTTYAVTETKCYCIIIEQSIEILPPRLSCKLV